MHKNPVDMHPHTSADKGSINENKSGGSFIGFEYKIPIPKVINGLVKSIAVFLSYVIVKSQIARSAF